uniref:At1g61320/AtMIF1 LRR domain-containing protein n=1 Tax=Manihot esculenta TaxID=3983 RepID=A0A2C9V4E0_MANES
MEFPNSLLSCESIKTLRLARVTKLPESFAFTKLNSLHLKFCTFESYDRRDFLCPFANCFNLKTLNISYCCFRGIKSFRISGLQLLSLSFDYVQGRVCKVDIFAPNLTYFSVCWGVGSLVLFNELNLPFLNIVDVHVDGT